MPSTGSTTTFPGYTDRSGRGAISSWSRCGPSNSTSGSADFLARHPDAVVAHLGCGLDTRAFRLQPPDGVQWFDVDVPQVIGLRRALYDDAGQYRMIASSVTDAEGLEQIPTDRPALVVLKGR